MKKIFLLSIIMLFIFKAEAQKLKPYILAGTSGSSISEVKNTIKTNLKSNGFEILGSYSPMGSAERILIVVTNSDIQSAIKKVGGLKGFALALRVALTVENGKVLISYTNPEYWGRAYFTNKWSSVSSNYQNVATKFKNSLSGFEGENFTQFGSKSGLSYSKLKKYHYMLGMPYFDDNVKLMEFNSFNEAVSTIDNNLKVGVTGAKKVYSSSIGGKEIKLYGIGLTGSDGEKLFMKKIDTTNPKHTAFLPYEMLVVGKKVYMLHGRYRIALAFPDLSMGQFMKIVSTPGYIEEKLKEVCK